MTFRQLHLLVGGLAVVLFLLTGQYMARIVDVPELGDVERLLYRSNHIYLLLAAIVNVAAGSYMSGKPNLNLVQRVCSGLLLALPLVLTYSFFVEAQVGDLERPITRAGLYLGFGIATLLLANECFQTLKRRRE